MTTMKGVFSFIGIPIKTVTQLERRALNVGICPSCREKGAIVDSLNPIYKIKRCQKCNIAIVLDYLPTQESTTTLS